MISHNGHDGHNENMNRINHGEHGEHEENQGINRKPPTPGVDGAWREAKKDFVFRRARRARPPARSARAGCG
jgi:hypothetical protein